MRGNEARRFNFDDQVNESHMEARIAKLESSVDYIKEGVSYLRVEMNAANASLATLGREVSALKATAATKSDVSPIAEIIPHLATKADFKDLERRMTRWFIATGITLAVLAVAVASLHLRA